MRHAADRQQSHIGRGHAEGARGEDMAELVQQHAEEQKDDENERVPGRSGATGGVTGREYPGEKQKERQVDSDHRARHPADIQ